MIGSEPIALPLGDTPIFLKIFNWLDIWLDALQFLLNYKTSTLYISSITRFITQGKMTRVRDRCLNTWRYHNMECQSKIYNITIFIKNLRKIK